MVRGEPQDLPALIPFIESRHIYKMTKARDLLGWQSKVRLQEGIERCTPWLRECGLLT
jgi:nucleoside-diphosphate-sugar epimerase